MFAADGTTSHHDAGACPACGHNDCWLGCGEADTDDDLDTYDSSEAIIANTVCIGDRIEGHTVYDIAPSALEPNRIIVAVARNGVASAYSFNPTEQITVER